jgi:basic membrane protein A
VALASEAAQSHLAAGADILTGTAQMVVGAIGVASQNGLPWFGTQANQTSLAPDIVVASQVYHWEVVLREIIANIEGGTVGGEIYEINLANGGLVIEFNDGFDLSDDVRAKADAAIDGIKSGSISTGQ